MLRLQWDMYRISIGERRMSSAGDFQWELSSRVSTNHFVGEEGSADEPNLWKSADAVRQWQNDAAEAADAREHAVP